MSVKIGSARIDENGHAHGGQSGDQTGKEVSTQAWYLSSKGWRVYRAKNPAVAEKIAQCMERTCANRAIGYDQYQRNTLYKEAAPFGFDVSKVTTPCETDCSALVRVCCAYAGITGLPADFRTGNMPSYLAKTNAFVELTGSKYTEQSIYLGRGDILVTKVSGHTVVVLTNGDRYEGSMAAKEYALGDRILRHGCEGADVKLMQEYLLALGYSLGRYGCDGDFGDCTELAVKEFQTAAGVAVDGECGPITLAALIEAVTGQEGSAQSGGPAQSGDPASTDGTGPSGGSASSDGPSQSGSVVTISGGNCYIRSSPSTAGKVLGVARNGDYYPYAGQTADNGWHSVKYNNGAAWVSGKYSRVV